MGKATGFFATICLLVWGSTGICAPQEAPEGEIVIEVTAPREEPAAGATRPTDVISAAQIQSQLANDVAEAVQDSPGLDLASYGSETAATLAHLRGTSPDQVLILVNGQRLNTLQGGGVDLARLSSLNIERIEVSRGAASSRFGADALGGVINIVTKSGENAPGFSSLAEMGSFGARRGTLSLAARSARSDCLVSFDRSYSEGDFPFTAPDGLGERRQNAQGSSHSLFSVFGYYPTPSQRLSLTVEDDHSLAGVPGAVEFPSPRASQEDTRRLLSLAYDGPSPGGRLRATLYRQQAQRLYSDPDAFPAPIDSDHRNGVDSADVSLERPVGAGRCTYGLSWRRDSLHSSNVGERDAENAAAFANAEFRRGRLTVAPEWRKDWQSQFGASDSAGLGVALQLGGGDSVSMNVSSAFRAPSFNDLYWPEDNFAVGNPNLRPERATSMDVTWERPRCSASIFRTNARDLIIWEPIQGGKWSPTNVGRAVMEGIEAETGGARGGWRYKLAYTLLHAYDATNDPVTSGKELIGRPMHQAHLRLTRPLGSWDCSLGLDASSKRFYTSANTKSLSGYLLADFTVSRRIAWLGTVSLSIRNLLDKEYETVYGYPVPGREVRLRLSKSL